MPEPSICKDCGGVDGGWVRRSQFNHETALPSRKGEAASPFCTAAEIVRVLDTGRCTVCESHVRSAVPTKRGRTGRGAL